MLSPDTNADLEIESQYQLPSQIQAHCLPFRPACDSSVKRSSEHSSGLFSHQLRPIAEDIQLPKLERVEWQRFEDNVGLPLDINSVPWEAKTWSLGQVGLGSNNDEMVELPSPVSRSYLSNHFTSLELHVLSVAIKGFNDGPVGFTTDNLTLELAHHILQNCLTPEEQQILSEDGQSTINIAEECDNVNQYKNDCDQHRSLSSAADQKLEDNSPHHLAELDTASKARPRHKSTWTACHACRHAKKHCDSKDRIDGTCSFCRHRQELFGKHVYNAKSCCQKDVTDAFLQWVEWRAKMSSKTKGPHRGKDSMVQQKTSPLKY